jgi:hypothetical protein
MRKYKWSELISWPGLKGRGMGDLAVNSSLEEGGTAHLYSSLEEEGGTATMATHLYSRPTTVFAAVAASLFTVVGVIGNQSPYL